MLFHRSLHLTPPLMRSVVQTTPRTTRLPRLLQLQKRLAMSNSMREQLLTAVHHDPVKWWVFGCAGMLATTMTVAAASRLTRSGASMLYWKPRSLLPPMNDQEWHKEFEFYHDYVQRHFRRPMTFEDFKRNFKWEYAHRLLGEGTALTFAGPLAYFYMKEMLPTHIHGRLAAILAIGATQVWFGRRMVHEHLAERHGRDPQHEPSYIAPHGLTMHSAFSLANLSLLLWTGFTLASSPSRAIRLREAMSSTALREIGDLRKYLQAATGLFLVTAGAGTIVAGIEAGKEYNTFPKMGDKWIPDGLFDRHPWIRNFYENPALVQLNHRLLVVSTVAAYSGVYYLARKRPNIWQNLPSESKTALNLTMAAVGGQLVMGVTMLVNAVPTSLAMVHQSGAVLILSTSLWSLYTLRFARPAGVAMTGKLLSKAL